MEFDAKTGFLTLPDPINTNRVIKICLLGESMEYEFCHMGGSHVATIPEMAMFAALRGLLSENNAQDTVAPVVQEGRAALSTGNKGSDEK